MRKLLAVFLLLNSLSVFAAENKFSNEEMRTFLDILVTKIEKNHGSAGYGHCTSRHLETELSEFNPLTNVAEMGLISFKNQVSRACDFTSRSEAFFKMTLLEIAKENHPEEKWDLKRLLKGWNGWSFDDTELKIKDIYNF